MCDRSLWYLTACLYDRLRLRASRRCGLPVGLADERGGDQRREDLAARKPRVPLAVGDEADELFVVGGGEGPPDLQVCAREDEANARAHLCACLHRFAQDRCGRRAGQLCQRA